MTDWWQGLCHAQPGLLPLFYSDNRAEQDMARELCFSCPIQLECLEYAILNKEKFGIWGGTLPAERKRLK